MPTGSVSFIFNYELNLEFHKPKQDRCDTCEVYKMKKDDERYQRHVQGKQATKAERDRDRERVKSAPPANNDGTEHSGSNSGLEVVICFDLENVLSCPRANISNFFLQEKVVSLSLNSTLFNRQAGLWSCMVLDHVRQKC